MEAGVKENASSIKKFYAIMLEIGKVTKDEYDMLCFTIKEELNTWVRSASHKFY